MERTEDKCIGLLCQNEFFYIAELFVLYGLRSRDFMKSYGVESDALFVEWLDVYS